MISFWIRGQRKLLVRLGVGVKIFTSKNATCQFPQKFLAATSTLASSFALAVACCSSSPDRGCNTGSSKTSWQTSVSNMPVRSLISLCRILGKAPLGQLSAWSMVKVSLHTHLEGIFSGNQPYLKDKASLKLLLERWNPYFSSGRVASREDEPLSWASSAALERWSGKLRAEAVAASLFLLSDLIVSLIFHCSALVASSMFRCWFTIQLTIGLQISDEAR